jgi:anthranilate synthase component 2
MKIVQMKLLIVDNYDSFTFNLVELIRKTGYNDFEVIKSDKIIIDEIDRFDKILFTPGPGLPKDFPVMFEILKAYEKKKSIFGVCLGHQAIGEFYGATLINHKNVVHGIKKSVNIINKGEILFRKIPDKIDAGLYHSWFVSDINFPSMLKITAVSEDNIIMALTHATYDVRGVQFHPESIMTGYGQKIIENWLNR